MANDPFAYFTAVKTLQQNGLSFRNFIQRSFAEPLVYGTPIVNTFIEDLPRILDFLSHNESTQNIMKQWVKASYTQRLTSQMGELSKKKSGFHFAAKNITAEKMKEVNIPRIVKGMREKAPDVWDLMGSLLQADPEVIRQREKARVERVKQRAAGGGQRKRRRRKDVNEDDDETRVFDIADENEDEPEDIEEQLATQWNALIHIVSI